MAKQEKVKTGFIIKLTNETLKKLEEEKQVSTEDLVLSTDNTSSDENIKQAQDKIVQDKTKNLAKKSSQEVSNSEDIEIINSNDNVQSPISSWGDYAPYISYKGKEAIYTDPSSNHKYTWNSETNAWVPIPGESKMIERVYSYENDTHIYTESDGSKFFWDDNKKAWIPKIDDDFLAIYQMSYGFVDNKTKSEPSKADEITKATETKADNMSVKRKNDPQWFEASKENNTKVYVSNLPLDLNEEEFVNFMQKCGLVERDPISQQMKIKLYKDKEQNCFKGDALCTYIKVESVELALNLLDGSELKGNQIKVERAHFELKGDYNPTLKPKKKKKKELDKLKKMREKLFDWRPEKFIGEKSKHERVVIIKNLFHPTDFDNEVQLILDYQQDLREECSKCGEVRKVVIYDRHPEGVAQVTMKDPEMAEAVVLLINGRWFGKRQITVEIWDGRTKYRIAETDADINQRINKWDKFLDGKDETTNIADVAENKVTTSEDNKVSDVQIQTTSTEN